MTDKKPSKPVGIKFTLQNGLLTAITPERAGTSIRLTEDMPPQEAILALKMLVRTLEKHYLGKLLVR